MLLVERDDTEPLVELTSFAVVVLINSPIVALVVGFWTGILVEIVDRDPNDSADSFCLSLEFSVMTARKEVVLITQQTTTQQLQVNPQTTTKTGGEDYRSVQSIMQKYKTVVCGKKGGYLTVWENFVPISVCVCVCVFLAHFTL